MTTPTIESFNLSPLQAHLVRLGPNQSAPSCARLRIQGELDATTLRAALECIGEQHEILRTSFPTLAGTSTPVQAIGASLGLELEVHELKDPQPDALDAIEEALSAQDFELAGACSLRAALVHFNHEEHLLILVQNPLCSDAASLWNLARCLDAALAKRPLPGFEETPGDEEEQEDSPLQMADVAQWFNDNFEEEDAQAGLEFWRQVPQTASHLPLPLAFDRGGERFDPEACSRAWSPEDEAELQAFASAHGLEADAVLSAVWGFLLARLGGREELVLGMRCDGRDFEGLADALGPFERFLPVALGLDKHASARDFLLQVARQRREAFQNYETFDYRRAGWDPKLPMPHGCGFRAPLDVLESAGRKLTLESRRAHSEPFELYLELDRGVQEPELCLYFDGRHFRGADAAILLEQFDGLLTAILADPSLPLGELPWCSPQALRELLEDYAPGPELQPVKRCVHELFSEQAKLHPERIAVRASNGQLTYAELELASNRLAQRLRALGVGPGSFVGLYLNRCVEQIVAILGVFKAGGAYLPLPPDYPAERIAFMLQDTGAEVLLTRSAESQELGSYGGQVILLDTDAELAACSADCPEPIQGLGHDAYVIFTSGSTGKPKGVPITHSNLAHSTQARLQGYRHPVSCYMVLSSFAFDSSVAGLYWALVQGGCLALPPDGFEEDIASLAALFQEYQVSHTLALPSLWNMILDSAQPGQLESLMTVIVAGESSSRELLKQHAEALPDCELINEYGPTEGTVWSSYFDCLQPFERTNVPIGRPIPGARVFIVSPELKLYPVGQAGELLIAGPGVARGYLGRPELSAERFVSVDFGDGEVRCYRTGDLARFLPGGDLEFLGRIDHQVKLRGYRIELEEIESRLLGLAAVREAVVIAREDTPGDKRLVAYLSASDPKHTLDPKELRQALAQDLPDYMLPAHFVLQDSLPLLPNGKVDRSNLPAPEQGRSLSSSEYSEAETPLEKVLVALWSDVLQVERVGADDDFFELGGHSILATRLFARLVDMLQASVSLRAIFDARTPRALAQLMLADPIEAERLEASAEVVLEVLEMDDEE